MNQMKDQMDMMGMNPMMVGTMGMNPMMDQMNMMGMNPMMVGMNSTIDMSQMMMLQMMVENDPKKREEMAKQINEILKIEGSNYYKKQHENPLNDEKLSKIEKNLSLFFNGIAKFYVKHHKHHKNGNKIKINYYNIEKIELYLDLCLKIKDLISIIFGYIFFIKEDFNYYKRAQENQTTEYIVNNPIIYETDNEKLSRKTIFLEYKNKNLLDLQNKTGYEIGLKNGEEILLKLNKNFYTKLISLPLDGNYVNFNFFENTFNFVSYEGESQKECIERLSSIFNDSITLSNPFRSMNNIIVFSKTITGGGPSIEFADISKGKTKVLKFSKSAPSWRKVKKGLNIFGICLNDKCKAHNKEVVYIPKNDNFKNYEHEFNLNDNIEYIKCPECYKIIKVKTCGFWKCEYQFKGKKIENGELIYYDSNPKETKDDNFEYFDPSDNGKVIWTELIIYVIPKQRIKYKQKSI